MRLSSQQPNQQPSIVGAGLIALDVVIPPDQPDRARVQAGGTCGNVLSILSYLGWKAFPVGRMNGDPASERIRADLERWGVRLDLTHLPPSGDTPVIVQKIRYNAQGEPQHTFSWACPVCRTELPRYQALHTAAVQYVLERVARPSVFFMDRVSRATINLARAYAAQGSLVVFEPASLGDADLFLEAVSICHILKYSQERLNSLEETIRYTPPMLEIQTLGRHGLRYRSRLCTGDEIAWRYLDARPIAQIVDTSGAGDWSTAGIIYCLGANRVEGLCHVDIASLEKAMKLGQELAAWNCQFLGARGGMYETAPDTLEVLLQGGILNSSLTKTTQQANTDTLESILSSICPACKTRE